MLMVASGSKGLDKRWCVPPGLGETGAGLPGQAVLRENPGDAGLLLWLWLRDVHLWAGANRGSRGSLFGRHAAERRMEFQGVVAAHPDLAVPAALLMALLEKPEDCQAGDIQAACFEIARWAIEKGAAETAVLFAVAAADANPTSGAAAETVGRVGIRCGRYELAEVWLRRALALARRGMEREVYSQTCMLLGRLVEVRGDLETAHRYHLRAWRMTRRHSLPAARSFAAFELLRLAIITGDTSAAERLSPAVRRGFPSSHPDHFRVWYDIAGAWLTHGCPERALPIYWRIVRCPIGPTERIETLTYLACAASGLRDVVTVKAVWDEAVGLISDEGETDRTARQLLDLAKSTVGVLEAWRVRQVVWRARELARRFGQDELERAASEMLWERHDALEGEV